VHDPTDPAIVLVHGWGGSPDAWRPVVERWPGPHALVPVALPAAPVAGAPDDPPTVEGAVRATVRLLESSGTGPAVLVGHSMGAQVTLRIAVERPDLVHREVVIDPAYGMPDDEAVTIETWADEIEQRGVAALLPFFESAFSARTPESVRERVLADVTATPPGAMAGYLRSEYLGPRAIGTARTAATWLRRRVAPLLVLHSTAAGARFSTAGAGPHTEVHTLPGHGHYPHLEDPDRFCALLGRWLGAVAGQRAG
jgi:pimeloyl-ACP methyl ester carboxylesterase